MRLLVPLIKRVSVNSLSMYLIMDKYLDMRSALAGRILYVRT